MNTDDLLKKCENAYWNKDYDGLIELCDEVLKRDSKNQIAMATSQFHIAF